MQESNFLFVVILTLAVHITIWAPVLLYGIFFMKDKYIEKNKQELLNMIPKDEEVKDVVGKDAGSYLMSLKVLETIILTSSAFLSFSLFKASHLTAAFFLAIIVIFLSSRYVLYVVCSGLNHWYAVTIFTNKTIYRKRLVKFQPDLLVLPIKNIKKINYLPGYMPFAMPRDSRILLNDRSIFYFESTPPLVALKEKIKKEGKQK